jgi:hypothetical protein
MVGLTPKQLYMSVGATLIFCVIAFQTAVALAVFDSKNKKEAAVPEVTENHLQQVVKMSSAFRKYMKAAHSGMDDSVLAFKQGNREDNFHRSQAAGNSALS